jgi:hypothetical protein
MRALFYANDAAMSVSGRARERPIVKIKPQTIMREYRCTSTLLHRNRRESLTGGDDVVDCEKSWYK